MKNTKFTINGVVRSEINKQGLADLLVLALDVDRAQSSSLSTVAVNSSPQPAYQRLGSVLTDERGRFSFEFDESHFKSSAQENRPDILLAVLAPEKSNSQMKDLVEPWQEANLLHISKSIRFAAGAREAYSILINQADIIKFQLLSVENTLSTTQSVQLRMQAQTEQQKNLTQAKIKNFQARMENNEELAQVADKMFSQFKLSQKPESFRESSLYWHSGKNLSEMQVQVFTKNLLRFQNLDSQMQIPWRIAPKVLKNLDLLTPEGELKPTLSSELWWESWSAHEDTILERRRRAREICVAPLTEENLNEVTPPVVPPLIETPTPHAVMANIQEQVIHQVDCMTCPEEPLRYSAVVDPKYKEVNLTNTINGLQLKSGPADVTAYYDFQNIQMAFESIWTEVFDESIADLGKQIFTEIVKFQDDTCADKMLRASRLSLNDPASLKSLLKEYRSITGTPVNTRLDRLFTDLEKRLNEPYVFDVFAPNSYNYGLMYTFRQQWEPGNYQVGRMVKSVPLAPKEERKYKTKTTQKNTTNQKTLEEREFKGTSESSDTNRAESEIVNRATQKTTFSTQAQGGMNLGVYEMQFGMNTGMEAEKFSSTTKKNFREAVLKASQEYRKQTKLEIETLNEKYAESTQSGKLINPNEEISVTYLFYELQRQFMVSEKLHRITPVVMVAFSVPKPHEIDDDWLMTYAWILRRVLLDESFHEALDFVTESSVGSELALQELGRALQKQQTLVDELNAELEIKNRNVDEIMGRLVDTMTAGAVVSTIQDTGNFINSILNPLSGLFGGGGSSGPDVDKFKEVVEMQLERSEKERQRLQDRIKEAQNDLLQITDKFGTATREHFNQQTSMAQLRIHIKDNILYYMQAIWDHEPPDQRYFRLYDLPIEWFEAPSGGISTTGLVPRRNPVTGEIELVEGEITLPVGGIRRTEKKLIDVADLDNLMGFKGNYAIFPVKNPNYVHLYMMKDYIDEQTGGLKDPDEFADMDTQGLIDYLKCVRECDPEIYEREKDEILQLINERRSSPRREKELVIVPTDSLYLECLPGKHPILEDFKLVHRAIDVKKAQSEVRKIELENLRYASRLLNNQTEDPEIEKMVRIEKRSVVDPTP